MAKKRKYAQSAGKDIKSEIHRYKRGNAKAAGDVVDAMKATGGKAVAMG